MHVLQSMARNIRRLNSQLSDIFFLDLPGRLARTMLRLADQHGRPVEDGILITLSLTQTDLAEMTGATRVSINKTLGRFRRAGWVGAKGRRFTILDRDALENLIQISGGSAFG
jgi:CRP/FNR family transcriptional regulator/CRP/FNR family cyclic AMP-dependent transcriptional regulator